MNDTEKLYTVSYNYKIKVYGDRARHLVLVTVYQLVEAASFPLTNACLNSIVKTSQMHYLPPPQKPPTFNYIWDFYTQKVFNIMT